MKRKSARTAARAVPSAWGSPEDGGEFTDLFERVLAAVRASSDSKATLSAMRLVSQQWRSMVDDCIEVRAASILQLQLA